MTKRRNGKRVSRPRGSLRKGMTYSPKSSPSVRSWKMARRARSDFGLSCMVCDGCFGFGVSVWYGLASDIMWLLLFLIYVCDWLRANGFSV